jgi:membrane-associated phospholipid phosphatase
MRAGLLVVVLLASASVARAQEEPAVERAQIAELRYELWLDASITGGAVAWWIISEILKGEIGPSTCAWCDPPGVDIAVRDALHWGDSDSPDTISYLTALAAGPIVVFGLDLLAAYGEGQLDAGWVDLLLIAEATAIAMAINQTVKLIAARERPFVNALDATPEEKDRTAQPSDNNLSFYSGHATFVFALAVAGGTIATMRGYRLMPWIWTGGLVVAIATAYLRIAADRHYLSDILVGVAAGSATGFVIPFFFHSPVLDAVGRPLILPAATTEGAMITATWRL